MEIVGGFMVMMSIISLFLAVVWLIMPFVVFAIKGKQDRTLEVLEAIEKRLAILEARLQPAEPERNQTGPSGYGDPSTASTDELSNEHSIENAVIPPESASRRTGPEASPAV
jgi:hypothetical protein